MPKETVHWGWAYVEVDAKGGGRTAVDQDLFNQFPDTYEHDNPRYAQAPTVEVYWARPGTDGRMDTERVGSVQIGVQISEVEFEHYIEAFNSAPQDDANRIIYTRRFRRDELNHFIRTLKRARDAAFGSDE